MNIQGIRSEGLVGITIPYEKEQGIFKMGNDLEIRTKDNRSIVSTDHLIIDIKDVHIPSLKHSSIFPECLCVDRNGRLVRTQIGWFIVLIGIVGWLWK